MKYREYRIGNLPDEETSEIVLAELSEFGFNSFTEYDPQEGTMMAYLPEEEWKRYGDAAEEYLRENGRSFEAGAVDDTVNWNEKWESGFQPIEIGRRCRIRAPFHPEKEGFDHEITVMPKMSFGTGHHPTTYLMLERVLDLDLAGKTGLDMGSGTGILAILTARKGAAAVDAIDIEEWACENCRENAAMNGVADRVHALLGDASLIPGEEKYDFILANINRNILLADMEKYAGAMKKGGVILLSGFLRIDVPVIEERARSLGLEAAGRSDREGWMLMEFRKP